MLRRSRTVGRAHTGDLRLFAGCRKRDLQRLANLGTRVSVRAGRQLVVAGARGAEVIVVLHGAAICEVEGRQVAKFEAGDFFGEIAVLDGQPRTATVRAATDMEVLVLDRAEFDQMIELSPEVAHRMLVEMAKRLRGANDLVIAHA